MLDIAIVITTWPNHTKRWEYFSRCIPRVLEMLTAKEHTLEFFCVSESMRDPKNNWYGAHLKDFCERKQLSLVFREAPPSLGGMMNSAMKIGSIARYTMIVQDDWYLHEPCDLSSGIALMDQEDSIDVIRYSWPGNDRVTILPELYCGLRRLDPKGSWPYGDDPHIKRRDFIERFSPYLENTRHGFSESKMLIEFGEKNAIVLLSDRRYFDHCGGVTAVINDERHTLTPR